MTGRSQLRWYCALLLLCCGILPLFSQTVGNMIGRQSQNEGMLVLPAPGKVTIDGNLADWDWSGRIWSFADSAVRNRFSVEAAAMWDSQNLYLAAKWKDPTPMFNNVNPVFRPNEGWKSDAWQVRIQTDQISHVTGWYYTPEKMPVVQLTHAPAGVGDPQFIVYAAGKSVLGHGIEMAFRMDTDGNGYVQEIKVPWQELYRNLPEIKAGLIFRLGNEFLWGPPTGDTWPMHRYADNMQPGVTSREFYWSSTSSWGNATLVASGHVPVRQYVDASTRIQGSVPVRLTIPKEAARFTIAINDAAGHRVRNLAGDCDPDEYSVSQRGNQRVVEVLWDGLDDHGKLVAPGKYQVIGLSHKGLGAEFDMSFYNPGTPTWDVKDGSGAWGADHAVPTGVMSNGEWTFISWPTVEGGSGLIGIGPDGKKHWGDKHGINAMSCDERYVYAIVNSWYGSGALARFAAKDGSYQPFVLNGTARPFELSLKDVFGHDVTAKVIAMAVHNGRLALAFTDGTLALLDATTAQPQTQFAINGLNKLAFDAKGQLYGLRDGKACSINLATGESTTIATPGVGKAVALAVDQSGNLVIADGGPDSQVKAYSTAGKLVYTCGRQGGRPLHGIFDLQGMMQVSSVAVDKQGLVWAVESWDNPRRVSVWGTDGKLVRDYIGNTGYSATGTYLHPSDPTLAYAGPIEMRLDRKTRTWKVTRVLWVPDPARNEAFPLWTHPHWFSNPCFVTSRASGKERQYLYFVGTYSSYHAIYMEKGDSFIPVAALTSVKELKDELPNLTFAGHDEKEGVIWNDANGDGAVNIGECTFVPGGLMLNSGWGSRPGDDLTIYTDGLTAFQPVRFTRDGAPVYGLTGMHPMNVKETGDLLPITNQHLLLCCSTTNYPNETSGILGINQKTETVQWSYPNLYPGVHGSHKASMAKPGLIIGPLKFMGAAPINAKDQVFAIRGNLGQDFFMTTDGLFVGALFQDGRLPGSSLPDSEAKLLGMPLEGLSNGGEPFSGWFGKQADGKYRLLVSMMREAGMSVEVKGLDTIRRAKSESLTITMPQLVQAERDIAARQAAGSAPKSYTVKAIAVAPIIDGRGNDWQDIPAMTIAREGSPNTGSVKLAYDAKNLYVLFDVQDPSPWLNSGKEVTRLFKTGDAVDLQFSVNGKAAAKRSELTTDDRRLVFAQLNGKAVVVLMRPIDPSAPEAAHMLFKSPVGTRGYDRVEQMTSAQVTVSIEGQQYHVEAAIPLAALGLQPQAGLALHGDAGIISSDSQGLINVARTYWSNSATNLVNDLPTEAWMNPDMWGTWTFSAQ